MSYLSHYCRNKLFSCLLGLDTFLKPNIYIGLSTTLPTDPPGSVTEPGEDYNRVLFNNWKIVGRDVRINSTISFYTKSDWGTIRYFTLWDAQVGGNLLGYGALDNPVVTAAGKVLSLSKNQLVLSINSGTITDDCAARFLEHLFGQAELSAVHTYIGLSYTDPMDEGETSEPVNQEYHAIYYEDWDVTDTSELVNTDSIEFPVPVMDWGIPTYAFIRDTTNRVLFYSPFAQTTVVDAYNPVVIAPYNLSIIFD